MPRQSPQKTLAGGILSGGQSSRMGQDKGSLMLDDGLPMIAAPLRALRKVTKTVVIAGPPLDFTGLEPDLVQFVDDSIPKLGPLSGLEAILHTGQAQAYLIAACDQPMLTEEVLRMLLSGPADMPCFFETDRIQPFPGYYPASMLSDIQEALKRKRLSVMQLIADSDAKLIKLTGTLVESIRSMNNLEDLASIRKNRRFRQEGEHKKQEHRHDHKCCRDPGS
ncbi:MAG: molybdenum cofactor guanylyltransferase [Candidatus Obscuribacterales bacterium]|nr:molybdenum cofactor guanylyltransferase [Candidatus Obscuribacterales bacterium]